MARGGHCRSDPLGDLSPVGQRVGGAEAHHPRRIVIPAGTVSLGGDPLPQGDRRLPFRDFPRPGNRRHEGRPGGLHGRGS